MTRVNMRTIPASRRTDRANDKAQALVAQRQVELIGRVAAEPDGKFHEGAFNIANQIASQPASINVLEGLIGLGLTGSLLPALYGLPNASDRDFALIGLAEVGASSGDSEHAHLKDIVLRLATNPDGIVDKRAIWVIVAMDGASQGYGHELLYTIDEHNKTGADSSRAMKGSEFWILYLNAMKQSKGIASLIQAFNDRKMREALAEAVTSVQDSARDSSRLLITSVVDEGAPYLKSTDGQAGEGVRITDTLRKFLGQELRRPDGKYKDPLA
jgi:hypothetical protein